MACLHRPMRPTQQEKNVARGALRAHHLEILENDISHLGGEGELLNRPILWTPHPDLFIVSVQIIQCQCTDFPDAQTVCRQQKNDCTIANVAWAIRVKARNQTSHLLPSRSFRKTGL